MSNVIFGKGAYLLPDVVRILKATGHPLSAPRIFRLYREIRCQRGGHQYVSKPICVPELPQKGADLVLTFRDLLELQCVEMFFKKGQVKNHPARRYTRENLRMAHARARDEFKTKHPFSLERFQTDGLSVFSTDSNGGLRDLASNEYALGRILEPFLKDVVFDKKGEPVLLRPSGYHGKVVIDPNRRFGQPILDHHRIPTLSLYEYHACAGESIESIARWFQIPKADVETAIAFEKRAS